MSRELKFRVWDAKEKRWDNPALVEIFNSDGVLGHLYDPNSEYTTIQQFTGIYDRDGKEIYEGDILLGTDLYNYEGEFETPVLWNDGIYSCSVTYPCGGRGGFYLTTEIAQEHYVKVIGNVHENPELLK